jgi:phospholipase/lecithinase/hemolysin
LSLIPGILANPATGPLPPNVVLNTDEVAAVRGAVNSYNAVIATKVAEKNGVLVDANALFSGIKANGYPLGDGRVLRTSFLGGLFSLDGVHPTNTGYAIIANEFIRRINTRYSSNIPLVNVLAVANADPLVPGNSFLAEPMMFIPDDATKGLQDIFKLNQ